MKEQIEEMAKSVDEALIHNVSWNSQNGVVAYSAEGIARELFDDGYRKQEWISVDDRLPDTDEVLVYYRKGVGHAAPKKQGLDKMDWDVFFNITGTTHWMPLPQPPKMKGDAE